MKNELDQLGEEAKAALYVIGVMMELQDRGLVGGTTVSAKGICHFDQLRASGFRPTEEQIHGVLKYGVGVRSEDELEVIKTLIKAWEEGKI